MLIHELEGTARPKSASPSGEFMRETAHDKHMQSEGDPRVHFVMNLVLSAMFAYIVLRGLDFLKTVEFSVFRLAVLTVIVMGLTQVLVLSD